MKRMMVISLICVLGIGFAGLASSVEFGGDATTVIDISSIGIGTFNWWAESLVSNDFLGARHGFNAIGSYDVAASIGVGSYGQLHTIVEADSHGADADFRLWGIQNFDVTNGHAPSTPYMRTGELGAFVSGTAGAYMNIDLTGSMYVFNDHGPYTYPTTANPRWMLFGEGDYVVNHTVAMIDNTTALPDAYSQVGLSGVGDGAIGLSNAWAFGTSNSGTIVYPSSGTMYVQASGLGAYYQDAYGANYLNFNGLELPGGGTLNTSGVFNNGFYGNPSVEAN